MSAERRDLRRSMSPGVLLLFFIGGFFIGVLLLFLALELFIGVLLFALAMQLWRVVELWRAVDLNRACLGQCRSKQSYR